MARVNITAKRFIIFAPHQAGEFRCQADDQEVAAQEVVGPVWVISNRDKSVNIERL